MAAWSRTCARREPRREPARPRRLRGGGARARFGERSRDVTVAGATHEFLGVRKLRLRSGQYLPPTRVEEAPAVCVIGAKVERELFPDRNPLGEFLRLGDERYRVIGVM